MKSISQEDQKVMDALQSAVTETLEKKRKLGHYAVIWQDGKPIAVGEDAPQQEGETF